MKKALQTTLDDRELIELLQILIDEDGEGALHFLRTHFKSQARDLLEGG